MKTRPEQQARLAYSPSEMASLIGVSDATAARMINSRRVGSLKIGSRRLIPATELEKLLTPAA
jgi:excisionase family DNA binding protein